MNFKRICNEAFIFFAWLSAIATPWIILIVSLLSAFDFYAVGSSVIYGVVGFFTGGFLAGITMIVVVLILTGLGYYTSDQRAAIRSYFK